MVIGEKLSVFGTLNLQVKKAEWKIIFFIAAGAYFTGNLIFVLFGRGDVQPWNNPPSTQEKEMKQMNVGIYNTFEMTELLKTSTILSN